MVSSDPTWHVSRVQKRVSKFAIWLGLGGADNKLEVRLANLSEVENVTEVIWEPKDRK